MIQALSASPQDQSVVNYIYVNLYDNVDFTSSVGFNPLLGMTSQQTGKTKYLQVWKVDDAITCGGNCYDNEHSPRYTKLTWLANQVTDTPTAGGVILGTKDFPYGFYDITIYQNISTIYLRLTKINMLSN